MTPWRGLVALTAVAVAVPLGLFGARVTWAGLGETAQPARPIAAPSRPVRAADIDLGPILALAPFGQVPQAAAPVAAPRQADLGLTLRGVILAAEPRYSLAILAGRDGKAAPYGPGDTLPGGATLDGVFATHVVVLVEGAAQTLGFAAPTGKTDGAAAIRARLPGAVAGTAGGAVALPQTGAAPDQVIATYRRLIADNPQAVLDRLGVTATAQGYRIGDNAHAGVRRAGLRPGDVIARVNGTAVGDIERDRRFFDEIAATGRARVEVVRDGQSIILSFPLR